jgi:quinol monooxygenase YgiN
MGSPVEVRPVVSLMAADHNEIFASIGRLPTMIYVIATIELAAGKRDEFVKAFLANVPNVLAEKGCIEYQPTVDLATEIKAQPAVRADVVTPHMMSHRERVKQLVKSVSIQVLEPA